LRCFRYLGDILSISGVTLSISIRDPFFVCKKTSDTASDRLRHGGHRSLKSVGPPTGDDKATLWNLGTWNVRGVYGKEWDLLNVMKARNLDVLCVRIEYYDNVESSANITRGEFTH
jgi:hypothetical protein